MTASQEEVYENTAKPLLDGVLQGYNATVFAYGVSLCPISLTPGDRLRQDPHHQWQP